VLLYYNCMGTWCFEWVYFIYVGTLDLHKYIVLVRVYCFCVGIGQLSRHIVLELVYCILGTYIVLCGDLLIRVL
jgi:hypothetical protein